MRFRISSSIVSLALAMSITAVALAQADDETLTTDQAPPAEIMTAPDIDQPGVAPTLFLQLVDPAEQDLEVPLDTAELTLRGSTLPGAVVSIDGDLVDTDDQGNFVGLAALAEGVNEIEIVASDSQGNQLSTTLFVVRGK